MPYDIKHSISFDNNRGFAFGHNSDAAMPHVNWQFTQEADGTRDYYWGHYFARELDAMKDYFGRVSGYIADNPQVKLNNNVPSTDPPTPPKGKNRPRER